jgi:hypothetical protein
MSISPTRQQLLSASCGFVLALCALLISGCGGGKSNKPDTTGDDQPGDAAADSGADAKPAKAEKGKKKGSKGTHIGEIPKDAWPEVWLKDPLAVAAESGTVGGSAPEAKVTADATPPAEAVKSVSKEPESKGGASDWATVISSDALADETKSVKNTLTANLADVGRYNSKYKELRIDAAVLTVLAGVAGSLPDAPSWKKNAKHIRDLASQVSGESKANGDKFYKKVKEAYDKLEALLSGNNPPGLEDAAEEVKFSEVANRYYLMERMKRSHTFLKTEVNSEAIFKKQSAKVAQEGAILSLLGKVIATPDYPDADADEYKGYAETVSQSGRDMGEAVKKEDFKAYTEALDRCYKACSKCHEVFKNG